MTDATLTVEFDGGSRGNPGPAALACVVRAPDGTPLVTIGRFIGRATNNVAEYQGLITGLEKAIELGARRVAIRGDSELIVKQIKGEYRVRHPDMRPLYERAMALLAKLDGYTIEHNYRHKNELADRLANLAMDRKGEVTEVTDEGPVVPAAPSAPTAEDGPPAAVEPKAGDTHACPRCGCAIEVKRPTKVRPHQLRAFVCQCGKKMTQV